MTPLIIGGILLIALIAYFAQQSSQADYWQVRYEVQGERPYDLKILYQLLDERFDLTPIEDRVTKVLPRDESAKGTSYLYMGDLPKYTEEEAWHLREYVQAGGNAFLMTQQIQDSLAELLFFPEDCGSTSRWKGSNNSALRTPSIWSRIEHKSANKNYYAFDYAEGSYTQARYWHFIPETAFCDSYGDNPYAEYDKPVRQYAIANLGTFKVNPKVEGYVVGNNGNKQKEFTNFVRVRVGEGYFYFHTNPIMFTNLYMVDTAGYEYANLVFAHLTDEQLYWDRESLLSPVPTGKKRRFNPKVAAQSPLDYIFSQQALRYSWYLALALGLIYILFGAKRRQRIVPILEPNRNTSLEFIETIGRLYFQRQDHKSIIKKQMQLFLAHVRQRYHLVTRDLDDRLIKRIAVRSRVDKAIINDIFQEYFRLRKIMQNPNAQVSAEMLNNFYLLIERFHRAARQTDTRATFTANQN